MGAYLSEPITEKHSSDYEGVNLKCGASSMQGWRVSQEDAHNCIIEYDKEAALFAVYDGHGGHEVAEYCAKNLPDFIKNTESYKNGDFEKALRDAFLEFDSTLATPEVITILKEIAGSKDSENKTVSDPDDGEVTSSSGSNEAQAVCHKNMCNGEVMTNGEVNDNEVGGSEDAKISAEVCLKKDDECVEGSGDSGSGVCVQVAASSDVKVEKIETSSEDKIVESSGDIEGPVPDSSGDLPNGETPNGVSSSSQNGDAEPAPSTEDNGDKISSSCGTKGRKGVKKIMPVHLYRKLLEDSDSEEEEDDETFMGESVEDSEDEDADSGEDEEEVGDEEDEEDEDEEDSVDDDEDVPAMDMREEPGSDSGCTAVVALMKGTELYVANAGDSRCVVCREGRAIEMSFDHKPEDDPERQRIEVAGGKVTDDGRVNGGLNLSRAIGDHSYKQVKTLPPTQQMITALPDIQRLQINPVTDEFMLLACDGIWNFMSSQDVVDFVRKRIQEKKEKLSKICEELFDFCLAPNTHGDGTGCDNMTCVIVQFQQNHNTNKRPCSPSVENSEDSKRMKKEEETTTE